MAAATAAKSGTIEARTTHFRTQMVNGKPQIFFDEIVEELPVRPQQRTKRNSRAVNHIRTPEQPPPKPKPVSQKPPAQTAPNKAPKKTNKVTVNENDASVGVFMTMEEIAELVKAVKDSSRSSSHLAMENRDVPPPPAPEYFQPEPPPPLPPAQSQPIEASSMSRVPPLDIPAQAPSAVALGPTSPREEGLGLMADKKRRKWMREKAEMDRMRLEVEYDQLKHQLTPTNQKASTSPERLPYPSDFAATAKPPMAPAAMPTDNAQADYSKMGLMEKKQEQWRQENADKAPVWNPFGRPGAGAPNMAEMQQRMPQATSTVPMVNRPLEPSATSSNIVLNDQTRVPAAMRTNLLLGDVRFEDDVKVAKEMERRQWLDDLQRQIEENKRKKFTQQENERRQDFLHENVQPLVQEASNRHQQQQQQHNQQQQQQPKDSSPTPLPNPSTGNASGQEPNKSHRHDAVVQQTYEKIVEATELAKYEKKQQLIEKLKRNGHKTDLLARTLPEMKTPIPEPTHRTVEKTYDSPLKKATTTTTARVEPLHLNTISEPQPSYRPTDARRDEAVNTVDSTFRSDNGVQTDIRMVPNSQLFKYQREESDLPPQVPQHLIRDGKPSKKNVRIRSHEEGQQQRRSSVTSTHSHHHHHDHDSSAHAANPHSHLDPRDLVHRPLWNYQNGAHREYVPNSKRDPHYVNRQRLKQTSNEQINVEQATDTQKRTPYNRWNSDGEIQHKQKETKATNKTQPRSIIAKQTRPLPSRPDPNPPREQTKERTFALTDIDDPHTFRNVSSLDKYDRFIPYTRSDEVLDPARAFSPLPQSREASARPQRLKPNAYDDRHHRTTGNTQAPPYHVPPSQQQHILQQLTAIKENLVRRQQEVATSMNAIPV